MDDRIDIGKHLFVLLYAEFFIFSFVNISFLATFSIVDDFCVVEPSYLMIFSISIGIFFLLDKDIRDTKLEVIHRIIPEQWRLPRHVVFDIKVREEDNCRVGGEEDEDMPDSVQVRKPN